VSQCSATSIPCQVAATADKNQPRGAYVSVDISARTSADRQYLFMYEFTVQEFPFFRFIAFSFSETVIS